MVYYNHQNIANFVQAKGTFPNNVYLPLNNGRLVTNQQEGKGRFVDQRPAESIELTAWINASIKKNTIKLQYNPITLVNTAYTADPSKDVVMIVGTTATITLPDPTLYKGWTFVVKSLTGVTTTLDPVSSVQIDGGNTATLTAGLFGTWITDGTAYYKIS